MEELPTDLKAISAEEVSVSLQVEELPADLKENSAEEVSVSLVVEELPTDLKEISAEKVNRAKGKTQNRIDIPQSRKKN